MRAAASGYQYDAERHGGARTTFDRDDPTVRDL